MNLTKGCNTIYQHYGYENQIMKLSEECEELAEAAEIYSEEPSEGALNHLLEEAGDVLVVLRQLIQNGVIDEVELYKSMEFKVERTLRRIGHENT